MRGKGNIMNAIVNTIAYSIMLIDEIVHRCCKFQLVKKVHLGERAIPRMQ